MGKIVQQKKPYFFIFSHAEVNRSKELNFSPNILTVKASQIKVVLLKCDQSQWNRYSSECRRLSDRYSSLLHRFISEEKGFGSRGVGGICPRACGKRMRMKVLVLHTHLPDFIVLDIEIQLGCFGMEIVRRPCTKFGWANCPIRH